MNVVIGLFTPGEIARAVDTMLENGYRREDLGVISTATDIPDFLEPKSEHAAVNGSVAGATAGGALGALGGMIVSTIPGMEASVLYGLMATATGSAIGGYLGSIYNERAESQADLDVRDALMAGEEVLVVQTSGSEDEKAIALLEQIGARKVEVHVVGSDTEG